MSRRLVTAAGVVAVVAIAAGVAYATIPGPGDVYSACMLKGVGTIRLIDKSLQSTNLMSHCTDKESEISWNQAGQPGPAGPQGAKGEPGAPGMNGTNGPDGRDGISVTNTALSIGDANCPNGGSKFTSAAGATYACNGLGHAYAADACGPSSFCPAVTPSLPLDLVSLALPAGTYVLMGWTGNLISQVSGSVIQCDLVDSAGTLAAGTHWHEVASGENNERHLVATATLANADTVKIRCFYIQAAGGDPPSVIQLGRLVAIRVDGLN